MDNNNIKKMNTNEDIEDESSEANTWTPKKGKVAEPGFWGQAPGKGVIWKATNIHHE